jgi:outer membrane protein TolC
MGSISQKLPTPGKLDTRGRIAAQDVAMAAQDLEAAKLSVTADTRRAYWSYYFADRAIEVIEAERQLLEQFRDAASARYEAGTAQQQDVLRASVEVSNLDNRLITLGQQRATAAAMLNRMLDRHVTAPLPAPRRVELSQLELQLDQLLADAAQSNPSLQKVRERIEAYRQRLKLAKLNRLPDLTLSLTYNAVDDSGLSPVADGKDQWWLGFGFNLPVWGDKLDAAEREARYGLMSGVAELTDQQNTIAFRVQDTMARVDTQQRLAILFRDVIVPQARQTVDASASAYRAGKMEFLTVVDNWRRLLDYELMYHQSLSQFEQALAELQQVIGRDVQRNAIESKEDKP